MSATDPNRPNLKHAITRNSDGLPASILGAVIDALAAISGGAR